MVRRAALFGHHASVSARLWAGAASVKKEALAAFRQIPEKLAQAAAKPAAAPMCWPGLSCRRQRGRQAGTALKKELTDRIKSEPAAAGRLLQTWIHEPQKSR